MPRSRFSSPDREPSRFQDRTKHLREIRKELELLRADPSRCVIFEVVGLGGVGKTRLLNEVQARVSAEGRKDLLVWVSLEAGASDHRTGPLWVIRQDIGFDCLLFDAALVTYWNATGQAFRLAEGNRLTKSLVFKALDVTRGAAGIATGVPLPIPLTFAADIYEAAARKVNRARYYEKQEFSAIDDLRSHPSALADRLPHYLGMDIRRRLESAGSGLVVFYDAYDRQLQATIAARAPWLREFIGTLDRGLHVITSREPINWDRDDWQQIMVPVMLDELPERDARLMVRERLGLLSTPVEDRILLASMRMPFFLEAMVEAYQRRIRNGESITVADLPSTPGDAVIHLLEHLPTDRQFLTIALAALQTFDEALFGYLIQKLNLSVSLLEFEEYLGSFFIEELQTDLYKTHDLLTAAVTESTKYRRVRRLSLEFATQHLLARCRQDVLTKPLSVLALFKATLAGWSHLDEVPLGSVEELVDIGYVLYDAGYWSQLVTTAEVTAPADSPIRTITQFFGALATRRTTGIRRGLELFGELEPQAARLGRHQQSVGLEVAYLSELAGNYAKARQEFAKLDQDSAPFDVTDRTHLRARLYHADMLIMDGEFRRGAQALLEAAELTGARAPLDWAELERHRAHAFRFSFLLQPAADIYGRALLTAAGAPSLLGKLQTNLVETYCWSEPRRALEAATISADLNIRLGNKIELAKCDAARGVALAKIGEFVAAQDAIDRSALEAADAGYSAGVAMALQAGAIVKALRGDMTGSARDIEELDTVLDSLGTYRHLMVAPVWLSGDRDRFQALFQAMDWFESESLPDRLAQFLQR